LLEILQFDARLICTSGFTSNFWLIELRLLVAVTPNALPFPCPAEGMARVIRVFLWIFLGAFRVVRVLDFRAILS
jgi:hypothetical protein